MLKSDFIDNISEGVFITDAEGRLIFANNALAKIHGYNNPDDLLNKYFKDFVEPSARNIVAEAFRKSIQSGETSHDIEVPIIKADGTRAFIQVKPSIYSEGNKITGTQGIIIDITERKQAEDALRESEAKYHAIFEATGNATLIVEEDTTIIMANHQCLEVTGYMPDELTGQKWISYVAPECLEEMIKNHYLRRTDPGKAPGNYEVKLINKKGEIRNALINVGMISETKRSIVSITDISERKRAEDTIRQAEERLRIFIENVNDMVYFQGLDGKLLMHNEANTQISGYSTEEFAAEPMLWEKIIHPDDVKLAREFFAQHPKGTPYFETEYRLRRKDGEWRWLHSRMTSARDSSGQYIGYNCIDRDITKQKHAEEELRTSEKKYRSLFENMLEGYAYCKMNYENGEPVDFTYLDVNDKFEHLIGLKNVTGKKVSEVIPGIQKSNPELFQIYGSVAMTGKPERFETYIDSLGIWFSIAVYSPAKEHFIAVFDNITERKRAEESLNESEKLLRETQQIAGLGSYALDIPSQMWKSSTVLDNLFGIDDSFIRSVEGWVSIIHPEDREEMTNYFINEVLGNKKNFDKEYRIVRINDSAERWVHGLGELVFDDINQPVKMIGTIQDITEHKRAEEALKLFRNLVDRSNDAIEVLDPETGRFLDINDTACLDLGYSREELLSMSVFDIDPTVDKSTFAKSSVELLESGTMLWEGIHRRKDGSTFPVEVNIKFVRLDRDYIVTMVRDITERKRAEEALRQSENKYRSIFENAVEGIFQTSIEGKYISANPALARIYGDESPEALIERVTDLEHQFYVDKNLRNQFIHLIEENGMVSNFEYQVYAKDGKVIWISENTRGVFDTNGKLIGYEGTSVDITERKHAEESLRITEKKHRDIITFAPLGIFQSSIDGSFTIVNHKLADILGYNSIDELMKLNLAKDVYYDPDERRQMIEKYGPVGFVDNAEIRWKKKDGTTIWIELSSHAVKNDAGETIYFESFVQDINERKRIEESLLKLKLGIERSDEAIFITDKEGMIQYVNSSFVNIYGYSSDEVIGRTPRILKSGLLSADNYKQFWETLLNKKVVSFEIINKTKDGRLITIDASNNPILDNAGNIIGFMGIHSDITVRKQYESELVEAKERAERSDKLKDAFIANISHEIRTPLNGILGMTGLIKNSLSRYIHSEENSYFSAIEQANARIVRTVDMILNFSRLQVGDFPIKPKQFNLSLIIDNLMKEYKTKAGGKSIKLLFENKCGEAVLDADEYCIAQAISNLIDNAIKYTVKGSVKLILYTDPENKLKLDVLDTGVGISEDYIEHIFEPYTQEEIGYNRGYEGVGLGMSLVKKYLELNEADITVVSKKDKGTTFTVQFNKSIIKKTGKVFAEVKSTEPVKHIPEVKPKSRKNPGILIVEDDGINQFYIKTLLKGNYETASAFSANSALEAIKSQTPDLILMDISLKGDMNGLELTKLLRESKEYKDIPIIAVTGYASAEDKQNCLNAGCNEFLSKPFSNQELFEIIEMFAGGKNK